MTWREDLRRVRITISGQPRDLIGASFRGVPFLVEEAGRSGGRRVVVNNFPFRPDPFIEDLDRRERKFPITGYVIGDDYMTQRDALLVALEDTAGPGELLHPYYGSKRAICDTVTVAERRSDGGIAIFTIDFVETPAQAPAPAVAVDAVSKVAASAKAARVLRKTELVEQFTVAGLPAFALASAETALTRTAAALSAALGPIATTTQQLAELTSRISVITARAASLVRQPADLIDALDAAIDGLSDTALAAPGAMLEALFQAYGVDLGAAAPKTTATRRTESANQQALNRALRSTTAIEAARLAPRVPYASIEDATAARDRVARLLEEQADGAGDTAYPGLVELRSQVLRAVPGTTAFARITTVTRSVALPSLLLAYQLYGSVDREADLLARNRIRHPGFVAGELKVLSAG